MKVSTRSCPCSRKRKGVAERFALLLPAHMEVEEAPVNVTATGVVPPCVDGLLQRVEAVPGAGAGLETATTPRCMGPLG